VTKTGHENVKVFIMYDLYFGCTLSFLKHAKLVLRFALFQTNYSND